MKNTQFYLLFLLAPILVEIIMGLQTLYSSDFSSLGIIIKGMIFFILFFIGLRYNSLRMYALILFCFLFVFITIFNLPNIGIEEISILVKLFFPLITYLFIKDSRITTSKLIKYFFYFNFLICASNLILIASGNSPLTYGYSFGFTGIFNSTNDLVVCLIFNLFLLFYLSEKSLISYKQLYIHVIPICTLAILTGSRTGIILSLFILFYFTIFLKINFFKIKSSIRLFFIISLVSSSTIFFSIQIKSFIAENEYTVDRIISLYNPDESNYKSPRKKGLDAAVKVFSNDLYSFFTGFGYENFKTNLSQYTRFRNSMTGKLGKHSELDFIDIIGYLGFICFLPFITFYFYIIYNRPFNTPVIFLSIMIIYSCIAGHVFMNTIIYLPFSLLLIFNKINIFNEKKPI